MPDLNRDLTFASFLFPKAEEGAGLLDQAVLAEQLGFDLVCVPDHVDWPQYVDGWTLAAAVIGRTTSIEVFSGVSSLALREPPSVLGKAAWSLDRLAPGRFHLGIGTGAAPGIVSIGGPERSPGEQYGRLREAIEVIRLLWSGGEVATYEGDYYSLHEAKLPAAPTAALDIWIGGVKPGMRRLTAQAADGWFPGMFNVDPDPVIEETKHLDDEILAAGRQLDEVRRLYNTIAKKVQPASEGFLIGPASQWIEELTWAAVELGFDTFLFGNREATVEGLHLFAEEIIPAVKANVAAARAGAAPIASAASRREGSPSRA
jgi:alkanesulfonate monooxygenase SsuD/methylene tetrahydromethanopterin reductase-like flavin-dependent oxidoreductase (luciferase family)